MARLKIVWSKEAEDRLHAIFIYYHTLTGNHKYNRRLNSMIQASLRLVAQFPRMYRATTIKDTRVFICEYFKIYYSIQDSYIYIETIFDARQDPNKDKYQ